MTTEQNIMHKQVFAEEALSNEMKAAINKQIAKFPADRKASASLAALRIVQDMGDGWVTDEQMDAIAEYLDMPNVAVYEVATFYSMCKRKPVGKHNICVCTNLSCQLNDCDKIVKHLEDRLDIKMGETTDDGLFSLEKVECLGACINAPMFQIGKKYYEQLTPQKVDEILEELKD